MAGLIRDIYYEVSGGNEGRILPFVPAPSSTFKLGDFLTIDSTGRVQQLIAGGSNLGSGIILVGQAAENALNDYSALKTVVNVIIAEPGVRFRLPLWNTTAATAVYNSNLIVPANNDFELGYRTAGGDTFPVVDISAATNKKVRIIYPSFDDYPLLSGTTGAGTVQYPHVFVECIGDNTVLWGGR